MNKCSLSILLQIFSWEKRQVYFSKTKISSEGGLTSYEKSCGKCNKDWNFMSPWLTRNKKATYFFSFIRKVGLFAQNYNLVKQRQASGKSDKTKERKLFYREG